MADSDKKATWQVTFTTKAAKQKGDKDFPNNASESLGLLAMEIEKLGPVRGNWKKYSSLKKGEHHCHIKGGRTSYVACWRADKTKRKVEFYYVGTHEKAPY